ncbi:hypothetical protein RHMOL_Rhmol10G0136100 [Rhododendron molle]|uniref:Uncharacterized protein n=1 Tax=Rhododendron molle TaxID=49168 RepID=A0ACC0M216_RHOML|nr:hypothetical protein RHMOL_Rhmol10G0136100 [Rhododendron molle]
MPPEGKEIEAEMDKVQCHCGRRAYIRPSWRDNNPGRRFLGCAKHGHMDACSFFMWVDPLMCARSREAISGLLRRTTQLEKEIQLCKQIENKVMAYAVVFLVFFLLWNLFSGKKKKEESSLFQRGSRTHIRRRHGEEVWINDKAKEVHDKITKKIAEQS